MNTRGSYRQFSLLDVKFSFNYDKAGVPFEIEVGDHVDFKIGELVYPGNGSVL